MVYKVFTKTGQGPWLRGDCLGPAGVVNRTPRSAFVLLSEFVSRNAWLQQDGSREYPCIPRINQLFESAQYQVPLIQGIKQFFS